MRVCLKEEQRLREALKLKGIEMEEIDESVFDEDEEETCIVLDKELCIDHLVSDSALYVSLIVSMDSDEDEGAAQWSDIVIRGSPFGVRFKSKEVDTIKIQYAWATHFIFRGGLFIESSSPYSKTVGEILLRRTLTILREFCGFRQIENWGRHCYSSIVTGRLNHSLDLSLLKSLFPEIVHPYSFDLPDTTVFVRHEDLLATSASSRSLNVDPMCECLRCGLLIDSIEAFELFLERKPVVLFLLQSDGIISCQGIRSTKQMHECYTSLFPFLTIGSKK